MLWSQKKDKGLGFFQLLLNPVTLKCPVTFLNNNATDLTLFSVCKCNYTCVYTDGFNQTFLIRKIISHISEMGNVKVKELLFLHKSVKCPAGVNFRLRTIYSMYLSMVNEMS